MPPSNAYGKQLGMSVLYTYPALSAMSFSLILFLYICSPISPSKILFLVPASFPVPVRICTRYSPIHQTKHTGLPVCRHKHQPNMHSTHYKQETQVTVARDVEGQTSHGPFLSNSSLPSEPLLPLTYPPLLHSLHFCASPPPPVYFILSFHRRSLIRMFFWNFFQLLFGLAELLRCNKNTADQKTKTSTLHDSLFHESYMQLLYWQTDCCSKSCDSPHLVT